MQVEIVYTDDTTDEFEYEYDSYNQSGFRVLVNVTWPFLAEQVEINPDFVKQIIVDKEEE